MLLHRIHLDPRCREARRDLSDPYQMHSTLCRAFSAPDRKCPEGEVLWRLEPESGPANLPRVLVQSRSQPDWTGINLPGWLARVDPAIDLRDRLRLNSLQVGQRFRFRLRANPSVTRAHKRLGLLRREDQEAWLVRKGELHGFTVSGQTSLGAPDPSAGAINARVSQEQMLRGNQHGGNGIRLFSVLYDGVLCVGDTERFVDAIQRGIGHGKAMGLGLFSVVPIR